MKGILVDVNIQGQMDRVRIVLNSPEWRSIWVELGLEFLVFADLGLAVETEDVDVWRLCQARQFVLVTANRNHDGPNSLGETILREGTEESLAVLTVADQEALRTSWEYVARVTIRLLEFLLDVPTLCGTGRLFLP